MTEEREIEEIASGLQSAFGELLIAATREADVRPMTLISVLGLDKSLASRITRAIKSPNPLGSLHLMPTASGLKKVLDAAENADAPSDVVQNARHAAKLYGDFLATFAGGRADLDAALATWIPELKDEMLRKARREIFRGWATTTGVRAGAFYSAHFILPGTTPGRLNVAVVSTEADVCRLRSGVPLKIAGFRFAGNSKSPLKNLDGGDLQADPLGILLKELTTVAPENCDVSQGADFFKLRILGDRPRINEPVTYSYGIQVADLLPATKCGERDYMWTEFVQLLAVTDFLADFYIHKDVRLDVHPIITRV
ncbi:MAG: hypothetical protein P1V35_16575, partial [Planctomycetota bacterium]|nr:hypothetical protein [Planctomycetota bacterium]